MKKFWEDYVDLCKESGNFMKKHWLGYLIVSIVIGVFSWMAAVIADPWYRDEIKDWFTSKFHKK